MELETDYLVIGAGAGGMAFTDELLEHTDATVTLVDRRHAPGGHWLDAYPFVRLHQPSAFYGVSSVPLGRDAIDTAGTNAGFYELASADELRAYNERVMHRHFLPTERVRYFPRCEYVGEHRFVSRLTGEDTRVRVRRKVVDATYMEGTVPATSPPPFAVADGVRCVTPSELARLADSPDRFVIIGGGKTALDTCVWLLERGVPASSIQWIVPRDAWWMNRKYQQPYTQLPDLYEGIAIQVETMAVSVSVADVFSRLESAGVFLRTDPRVTPTIFRGAITSEREVALLRGVEDVVRMGHVHRIERDAIVLDEGRVPTTRHSVHVHCAARGLARKAPRPVFEPGLVTLQPFFYSPACYQFAMLGVIEATVEGDAAKNALCPARPYWDDGTDYLKGFFAGLAVTSGAAAHPALAAWNKATRLNPISGIAATRDDARVTAARERIKRFAFAAAANLQKMTAP